MRKGILDVGLYQDNEKELMLGSLAALGKLVAVVQSDPSIDRFAEETRHIRSGHQARISV